MHFAERRQLTWPYNMATMRQRGYLLELRLGGVGNTLGDGDGAFVVGNAVEFLLLAQFHHQQAVVLHDGDNQGNLNMD